MLKFLFRLAVVVGLYLAFILLVQTLLTEFGGCKVGEATNLASKIAGWGAIGFTVLFLASRRFKRWVMTRIFGFRAD